MVSESARKKMKDKGFAAGVDREDVRRAAELLGVELADHATFVIEAMRGITGELGMDAGEQPA